MCLCLEGHHQSILVAQNESWCQTTASFQKWTSEFSKLFFVIWRLLSLLFLSGPLEVSAHLVLTGKFTFQKLLLQESRFSCLLVAWILEADRFRDPVWGTADVGDCWGNLGNWWAHDEKNCFCGKSSFRKKNLKFVNSEYCQCLLFACWPIFTPQIS